ncbi:glycosyltransferase family 2 protein [[Phormidium] sp. ETS-05]|uniref:glycosyltransferase n=1 Tax=[Phormidium] sp. ETS-05 TaxID=222819 RepID=UPI001E5F9655|nr:glycosyltransferase [[Phormidium] sp. ETS-05]
MTNDKGQMTISVVVPVYNGEEDLPDLIDCLKSQTYPPEQVEYIIVDNNSRDRTSTILAAAANNSFPLKPLSENQIQSSYAARNRGIQAAKGEIIAFTDADCRPEPDWLLNLIKPFGKPEVGIVAGEITAYPGSTLLEKYAQRKDILSQKHTLANSFCPYGQTANLAIRQQVLREIGLFRPYLTTGGDADLCWRVLRQTHWRLEFAPDAIVKHRHRRTLKQLQSQWRRYGESNRYLHQLHGVELGRPFTAKECFYRLSRWLLKELPVTSGNCLQGKAELVEMFITPLDLICAIARASGQENSSLPQQAEQIEVIK